MKQRADVRVTRRGQFAACVALTLVGLGAANALHAALAGDEPTRAPVAGTAPRTAAVAPSSPVSAPHKSAVQTLPPGTAPSPYVDRDADCRVDTCIALTFDDGPSAHTPELLNALRFLGANATFFVVGNEIEGREDVLVRAVADGNEIGNHTWSHADLTKLDRDDAASQLTRTADAVEAATGVRPTYVRPPYGARNHAVDELVAEIAGGPEILWDVDPRDWDVRDTAAVTERVLADAKPGAIVIMHDTDEPTVLAVPAIVNGLRAHGFRIVTISQLLVGVDVEPGKAYGHG